MVRATAEEDAGVGSAVAQDVSGAVQHRLVKDYRGYRVTWVMKNNTPVAIPNAASLLATSMSSGGRPRLHRPCSEEAGPD